LNHLRHHARFYTALAIGIAVFVAMRLLNGPLPIVAAGDAFFLSFLLMVSVLVVTMTPEDLDRRADEEDEGIVIVTLITGVAIAYSCVAIFSLLNQKHPADGAALALAVAGAPLGWLTLHMICAFHYAYLYYSGPTAPPEMRALRFPGDCNEPGPWDFVYFSFVIGMTAQVSDVLVQTTRMRRAAIAHGITSFLFNTVLIAMAVNAVVAHVQTA
jgi:uncharacterized membrane protein